MEFELLFYKEVISWEIRTYIFILKRNDCPEQYGYWLNQLKKSLKRRKVFLKSYKKQHSYQLKLF